MDKNLEFVTQFYKGLKTNILDKNQILTFYHNVICCDSERSLNAVDFFCVAARKKYMSEEERKHTNLGDTCMMQKTILKEEDPIKFYSKIQQVDATLDFMLDRDYNYLPRSCMTFYMNVNHTDVFKAAKQFKHLITDWDYDLSSLLLGNGKSKTTEISKQFKTIQNNLLKSFQDPSNCVNTKGWIDIDCDIEEDDACIGLRNGRARTLKRILEDKFRSVIFKDNVAPTVEYIKPYVIETHGGIHILIHSRTISEYNRQLSKILSGSQLAHNVMKVETLLADIESFLTDQKVSSKELKVNQNRAVPIPGTLQGGFPVKIF